MINAFVRHAMTEEEQAKWCRQAQEIGEIAWRQHVQMLQALHDVHRAQQSDLLLDEASG